MKSILRIFAVLVLVTVVSAGSAWAGNDNRRGTAGANELLINPWARSSGWGSVNVANVCGLDGFFTNVAGLTYVKKFGVSYSNTSLYGGKTGLMSGGTMNAFALGIRVLDAGVLGVYVNTLGFGDIEVTSYDSPDGGNGTFSPTFMNINVAYAHAFTQSIRGGVNLKVINETTADITGSGFAIDAGIQYVTGADDQFKFGITMKNIGFGLSFDGTGIATTFENEHGNDMTVEYRSADMEFPTSLNIGLSYDFLFPMWDQRLTVAGAFNSNAFLKDNFIFGLEYGLLNMVQLRCGYVFQKGIFDELARTTANAGLCAGASFELPLSKDNGTGISIDYSYRASSKLKDTHTIGATIKL